MRRLTFLLSLSLLCCLTASAAWATPLVVPVQGALTTPGGAPVADGAYAMTFRLYPDLQAPDSLYKEIQVGVQVSGGVFATTLGKDTPIPTGMEFDKSEKLRHEKEMLGLYVSDHPLLGVEGALKRKVEHSLLDLQTMEDGAPAVVGGIITNLARKFTKKGDQMAVFVLEDLDASIEVTIFPRTLAEQGHKLDDDLIVSVKGRLDRRDESRFGLIGQTINVLHGLDDGPAVPLRLRLPATSLDELKVQRLKRIIKEHPGESVVMIDLGPTAGTDKVLKLADDYRVDVDRAVGELRMAFGHDAVLL